MTLYSYYHRLLGRLYYKFAMNYMKFGEKIATKPINVNRLSTFLYQNSGIHGPERHKILNIIGEFT